MFLLLLPACPDDPGDPVANPTGDGLFLGGCPVAGEATARMLVDPAERPWGEEGLAGPGDALLLNEHAAFVIQGVGDPDTYYHYGGGPIDAVAVQDCEQAGPELLEEMGFIVGQLDLADFVSSTLHQVRAEEIEVVNDGTNGEAAVVEVHGTDDHFWLVEMTLVRSAWDSGSRKLIGDPYGLQVTTRYTLEPGASALQVEVILDGDPPSDGFMVGAVVFPSDLTEVSTYADGDLSVGGFGLDLGVPWLSMASDEGSLVVAMPEAQMAYTSVAGVRALLDVNQALSPLDIAGAAEARVPFLVGVGPGDGASASASLEPNLPEPLGVVESAWTAVSGTVAGPDGPVAGAWVTLEAPDSSGGWATIDTLVADASGRFAGRTVLRDTWRAHASAPGRDDSDTLEGTDFALEMGAPGALIIDVIDDSGEPIPARVELERGDGFSTVLYAVPGDVLAVPPGDYSAWVARGYEYDVVSTSVTIPESGEGLLSVTLDHLVDTTGWASLDTHVHQAPSADSDTVNELRFRTVVASGLDIMVSTDHEAIIDLAPELEASGLGQWMAYGLGEEVTATIPEHSNAWPFPAVDDPRGSPPEWYQLGFPGIYAATRERGASVIQLNHSRVNGECGILCVLDWDRLTDPPATDDPEGLALLPGTEVWSWDFDSFEVLNDARSPLIDPADPRHTGALVDWLAFANLGYPRAGVAVTDVHGLEIPGQPRTYVRVADDDPAVVTADEAAEATLDMAALISAGAFAEVSIEGAGPGELAAPGPLSLRVQAIPQVDVTTIYVLVNCDLAATVAATDPGGVVKFDGEVELDFNADAHVVVLGFGVADMPRGLSDYDQRNVPRFISNPVLVDADGDGAWTAPGPKACDTGVEVGRALE